MKQLHYTSCRAGRSVSGRSGFQVRAASAGLTAAATAALEQTCRYKLPPGLPDDTPPPQAPTRLCVVPLPDGGRAVVHSTHVGPDPETGRAGNYFSHAVAGTAAEIDPLTALRSLDGRAWVRSDGDWSPVLNEMSATAALAPGGTLADAGRPATVREHRPLVEFLLTALLADPTSRLFALAPPPVVARCLDVALSVLPPSARGAITFSTYEPPGDLITAAPRVVGSWDERPGADLDPQCYGGVGLGFNPATGKRSPLPPAPEYVADALDALAAGRPDALAPFLADADRLRPTDGPGVGLLYRLLYGRQPLAAADLDRAEAKGQAERVVKRSDVVPLLADLAAASRMPREYATALAAQPDARARVAGAVWDRGLAAARAGDTDGVTAHWETALPAVDPQAKLAARLLAPAVSPKGFPFAVRRHLLPALLKAVQNDPTALPAGWLDAQPNELRSLLAALPDRRGRRVAAERSAAAHPAAVRAVGEAAASDPVLVAEVAETLLPTSPQAAGAVVAAAVAANPAGDWFRAGADLLTPAGGRQRARGVDVADLLLTAAADGQKPLDVRRAAAEHGAKLLAAFPRGGRCVLRLGQRAVDTPGWVGDPAVRSFLEGASGLTTPGPEWDEFRRRVTSGVRSDEFFRNPQLDDATLTAAADAIRQASDRDPRPVFARLLATVNPWASEEAGAPRRAELAKAVRAVLSKWEAGAGDRDEWDAARPQLESVLAHLGPLHRRGPAGLFDDLRRKVGDRVYRHGGLLYAFLAVGDGRIATAAHRQALANLFTDRERQARTATAAAAHLAMWHKQKNDPNSVWGYVQARSKRDEWEWWTHAAAGTASPQSPADRLKHTLRRIGFFAVSAVTVAAVILLTLFLIGQFGPPWLGAPINQFFGFQSR